MVTERKPNAILALIHVSLLLLLILLVIKVPILVLVALLITHELLTVYTLSLNSNTQAN